MKTNFLKASVIIAMLMTGAQANAQVSLGNILSGVSSAVKSKSSSTSTSSSSSSTTTSSSTTSGLGSLISGLTSVFSSSKTATADKLVGTWKYTEPAVVLSDDNVLKNLGGKAASAVIEKKLASYLTKAGITKGKMTMTFDSDGNFTQTISKKKLSGTYTIDGQNVVLTYTGGVKQMIGTTQLSGNKLQIVMDASSLLKYGKTLGSLTGNSTVSTIGSLLSGYDGLQVGITLEK